MKKKVTLRSLLIGGGFTLLFVALMFRMYYLQVVEASVLLDGAKEIWSSSRELNPQRGAILDRNGKVLVQDGPAYTVAVNPALINKLNMGDAVVNVLAPALGMDDPSGRLKLIEKVNEKNARGEYYKQREIRNEGWKIDGDTAALIREGMEEKGLEGIYLIEEQKRYYPTEELAAHVLGYRGLDGTAALGLEFTYDETLKGIPGMIRYDRDRLGYELPNSKAIYEPAVDGKSLRLTIDENIQVYIEQAMQETWEKYRPKAITAVAVDPQTMEVLGMANMPTFNPNTYWDYESQQDFFNSAISGIYEPGSTFKIVTLSAAVEEGIFNPNATYQSGSIRVPGATIHDHNYSGWSEITYLEGLKRSSNVAFVKLGYEQLGYEKLNQYILDFGFGEKTGIDLPGEQSGRINFRGNIPSEVATATFGQGRVSVTAIQQVAAISAIANGGKLMEPILVKEVLEQGTGKVVSRTTPKVVRQVVSPETAEQVSEYLEGVISDQEVGTGRKAYIEGYRIAGKTGTAQKVVNGRYSQNNEYVVSFVGFGPVEDPRIALIVIVDEPRLGDYREGGDVVAPLFKEIMSKSLRYLGVAAKEPAERLVLAMPDTTVPQLEGFTRLAAENELLRRAMDMEWIGTGDTVLRQFPEAGGTAVPGDTVLLLSSEPKDTHLPDLTGKSLRDALQVTALLEYETTVDGQGFVVHQSVTGNRSVHIVLRPPGEPYDYTPAGEEQIEESPEGEMPEEATDSPTHEDWGELPDIETVPGA
ncbi:stage V sporulation protein D [Xylanibacillus composti]|uniref:Penicillin-binding protein 2B n=1 Tax=Xylanibacillus composti TaxID=1572762 RepID=A0A8J4GZD3_9BACL|nr:penicillin-binding transpeptidase domain-containing protein [Xylanibacillus composti]MDT9724373.1 stage V sporulation protein D [Xylanibacillus composti]GIQ67964.1 penicillin-binding protein 2B [Xylanibacillus composti]